MARVCQMCGHTGFQIVMIYCRGCKTACQHKYCLYKFPKKGEKLRWYCEECKPIDFAASSPRTLEVDTGRGKSHPESIQELQNQEPNSNQKPCSYQNLQNQNPISNLKTNSLDAFCIPQFEMVQEEAKKRKSSSDLLEEEKSNKRRKLTVSTDSHMDQKAPGLREDGKSNQRRKLTPDTPSNLHEDEKSNKRRKLTVSTHGHLDEKAPDRPSNHFPKLAISNDCHLDQKAPDTPSNHFLKLAILNDTHLDRKAPDTVSDHFPKLIVSNECHLDQKAADKVSPEARTHKDIDSQEIAVNRLDTSIQNIPLTARPIADYVWRGCISFGNAEFIPFRAHLSCLASPRVADAVKCLPPIIPMDSYLRRDLEQNIFKSGPPTGGGIGLYFFPDIYAKPELVSRLIDDSIKKDLMFVFTFDELDLFIFLSSILPEEHHKFNEQYYLWGGFRKKQPLPLTATSANHLLKPSIEPAENIQDKKADIKVKAEDKAEAQANLFGSPITEKLSRIIQVINEKHTQNNNKDPSNKPIANKEKKPCENGLNTQIRRLLKPQDGGKLHASPRTKMHAQQVQKGLLPNPTNSFATRHTAYNSLTSSLWNPQDGEKLRASPRGKMHAQRAQKGLLPAPTNSCVSRHAAYNNLISRLTLRQRSLYELKKENIDVTRNNIRTEDRRGLFESRGKFQENPGGTRISSRVKRKTETNGEDWIAYFEEEDMRERVTGARSKRNRTRNDSSEKGNAIEDEAKCDEKANGIEALDNRRDSSGKGNAREDEQIAGDRSASPVSSTSTEEQKPRAMMEKFEREEGEISS